jgi:hypothetical protein
MPTSVRLDVSTEQKLERLARQRKTSKSAILREAVDALARRSRAGEDAGSVFSRVQDLIGCVRGGPRNLSTRTGEKFRRLLEQKRRR